MIRGGAHASCYGPNVAPWELAPVLYLRLDEGANLRLSDCGVRLILGPPSSWLYRKRLARSAWFAQKEADDA